MDLKAEKLDFIQWLAGLKDQNIMRELVEWRKSHDRVSIDQYNAEIEEADQEIEQGDFLTHQEAIKEISSWREK